MKQSAIKFLFCTWLLLIGFGLRLSGQNVEFTKQNFPGQKRELRIALLNIKEGDKLFELNLKGAYGKALDYYLPANNFNSKNAWLNYKIGVCYLNSFYQNLSLTFLEKAYQLDSTIDKELFLNLGRACHYNSQFDRAISLYKKYRSLLDPAELKNDSTRVNKLIYECESGKLIFGKPTSLKIENVGNAVNSMWDDYCPILNGDETIMAFTSRREGTTGGRINLYDYLYYEDIYFTYKDLYTGEWSTPENPGRPLNSRTNDATVYLSPGGDTITIYKNAGHQDYIFESQKVKGKWRRPVQLSREINAKTYHQPSATYTNDRKTIYFVSNKSGGFGGADIYKSNINERGRWGPAVNLGGVVNSKYDEEAPWLVDDSILYFSSKGHNSCGGYDIFVTQLHRDGSWSNPVNLGYPMNSTGDDIYLIFGHSGDIYFSSNRQGGMGGMDLYHINFNMNVRDLFDTIPPVFVSGQIFDAETAEVVTSKIKIKRTSDNTVILDQLTDSSGKFSFSLKSMKEYSMAINPVISDPSVLKKYTETGTVYTTQYIPTKEKLSSLTTIKGSLVDQVTGRPLQFPIEIIDVKESRVAARIIPDSLGNFVVELPSASSYQMNIAATGCKHKTVAVTEAVNYTENIITGKSVRLENIYFDFDKSYIRPDAIEIINRHADLFNKYKNWKILISGHTDNMGSESYNQVLSENRARSTADYLVSKGIKRNRLKVEGMGYRKPIATNETNESRQLNRRCEFKILK